jgi:hypothetical protein
MPELIPFRWPAEWKDPAKLDLIKGTPINCLAGEAPPAFPLGELKFIKLEKYQSPEGVTLLDGVWPRILPSQRSKDAAEAGPTGAPWVDSNTGPIRLAQTREPGKPVWLGFQPPSGGEAIPLSGFVKPIAEAAAYGARWIIALSPPFIKGLDAKAGDAVGSWNRMVAALKFFESHAEWRTWEPVAALAVVSTFEGESELMSAEFLNLAPRRQLAYRAVRAADAGKTSFEKQKAIVYIEARPPEGELQKKFLEFAEAGGLVVSPRGILKTDPDERRLGYQIHRVGKGRVAVPLDPWDDPYRLVREVHLLMSHREDVVRLWNGSDVGSYFVASPKGDRGVVHLVQYGSNRTQQVAIGVAKPYRRARVYDLESEKTVKPVKGELGFEIPVGEFQAYAAVELEA